MKAEARRNWLSFRSGAKDPYLLTFYVAIDPFIVLANFSTSSADYLADLIDTIDMILGFLVGILWFVVLKRLYKKFNLVSNSPWLAIWFMGLSVAWITDVTTNTLRAFPSSPSMQVFELGPLTILLGLALSTAVALLARARERFNELRLAIVSERVRHAMPSAKETELPELKKFILEAKEALSSKSSSSSAGQLSSEIRSLVEFKLRPMSQKLWQNEESKLKRLSSGRLFWYSISQPIRTSLFPALFGTAISTPYTLGLLGEEIGPQRLIALFASIAISLFITRMVINKLDPAAGFGLLGFVASGAIAAVFAHVVPDLFFGSPENQITWRYIIVAWSVISLAGLVGNILITSRELVAKQNQRLQELMESEIQDELFVSIRARNAANYLHSATQNKLLAMAMRIEKETESEKLSEELDQVLSILDDSLSWGDSAPSTLESSIESIIRSWEGLIQFDSHLDIGFEPKQDTTELISMFVNEAVSNAFRHGKASKIELWIKADESEISISIRDDGLGLMDGKPGLGQDLFSLADRYSRLQHPDGGVILDLVLQNEY